MSVLAFYGSSRTIDFKKSVGHACRREIIALFCESGRIYTTFLEKGVSARAKNGLDKFGNIASRKQFTVLSWHDIVWDSTDC